MFAYYAKWIKDFSFKIKPLTEDLLLSFNSLKEDRAKAYVFAIDEHVPFVVETDATDIAISATLNQDGRPVAFDSRMLSKSEIHYVPVEKEARAIVEAVVKWTHYLLGRHFTLVTDQEPVSFVFDGSNQRKIKNEKILRWRINLSCLDYDILYRKGELNTAVVGLIALQFII